MSLVDAGVLIDHLRGHQPAVALLDRLVGADEIVATSEVVRFEVLTGMRDGEEEATEALFHAVGVLPVTEAAQLYDVTYCGSGHRSRSSARPATPSSR